GLSDRLPPPSRHLRGACLEPQPASAHHPDARRRYAGPVDRPYQQDAAPAGRPLADPLARPVMRSAGSRWPDGCGGLGWPAGTLASPDMSIFVVSNPPSPSAIGEPGWGRAHAAAATG